MKKLILLCTILCTTFCTSLKGQTFELTPDEPNKYLEQFEGNYIFNLCGIQEIVNIRIVGNSVYLNGYLMTKIMRRGYSLNLNNSIIYLLRFHRGRVNLNVDTYPFGQNCVSWGIKVQE